MDTKHLSGLLFLLGTASLAMPGCDDDDSGDTGAGTDGMTATDSGTSTGSTSDTASDSNTSPSTDSDTTPTTDSDTTPTTGSDTTPTTDSDTTPTTATDTDTDTDTTDTDSDGTTITDTGIDTGTTTGIDTVGPNEVCTGYASVYEECYDGKDTYDYDMNVEFCETAIAEGLGESPECGEAVETWFGCVSGLSCKEFNSRKACVTENDAALAACPGSKG